MSSSSSNNTPSRNGSVDLDVKRLADAWKWLLRLREDSVKQDDLTAWLRWYEVDERNKEAFEDMQSFWQQAERLAEEPNPLAPELWLGDLAKPRPLRTHEWRSRSEHTQIESVPNIRRHRGKFVLAGVTLAAGLFGLLIASQWFSFRGGAPTTKPGTDLGSNSPPLVEEANLPDGSRVDLAPKTQVAVLYSAKQRLLEMQSGEAYFTVIHNRERPFVVKVGNIKVRAVGTAFDIHSAAGRVVVTVTQGTVEVYPVTSKLAAQSEDGRPAGAVRVKAGSEVVWAPNAQGPTIASVDTAHALAWRQGRLDYMNEPLSAAVADINRYSKRRIIIGDVLVGRIVFSGTILTSETETWIRALPTLFPIDLQTNEAGDIVLVSRVMRSDDRMKPSKAK